MTLYRLLALTILALASGAAALAAPAGAGQLPQPSSWLTTGCVLLLLTTMQRRR